MAGTVAAAKASLQIPTFNYFPIDVHRAAEFLTGAAGRNRVAPAWTYHASFCLSLTIA
jgi:hypothetical protein